MLVFDVEGQIVQKYNGEARLQRLLFVAFQAPPPLIPPTTREDPTTTSDVEEGMDPIASRSSSNDDDTTMRSVAISYALEYSKAQRNVIRYKELYSRIHNHTTTTPFPPYDASWVQETEEFNRRERDQYMHRLSSSQAHLHKDGIRNAYQQLSNFYQSTGDIPESLHAAIRSKEYCTTHYQTVESSIRILETAIYAQHWSLVRETVARLENTLRSSSSSTSATTTMQHASPHYNMDSSSNNKYDGFYYPVGVAAGLEALQAGRFAQAANRFRSVVTSTTNRMVLEETTTTGKEESISKNHIVHASDVAMYAVVLTLAYNFDSIQDRPILDSLAEHEGIRCEAPITTGAATSMSTNEPPSSSSKPVVVVAVVLRDILKHFLRANYQTAWNLLEQYVWPVLRYDPFWNQDAQQQHPYHLSEDGPSLTVHHSTTTRMTPYEIVRNTIRCKAMAQYWKPYHNCPLSRMEEDLGTLVGGGGNSVYETVVGLLRQRRQRQSRRHHHPQQQQQQGFHPSGIKSTTTTTRHHSSDPIRLDLLMVDSSSSSSSSFAFPTDTRINAVTQTLVRSSHDWEDTTIDTSSSSFHFYETSTRVLDQGYAMVVVAACLEHGLTLDSRSTNPHRHGTTTAMTMSSSTSKRRNPSSWNTSASGAGIGGHEEDGYAMAGSSGNQSSNSSSSGGDHLPDDDDDNNNGDNEDGDAAAGDFVVDNDDDDETAAAPIMMVVEEDEVEAAAEALEADANMQMNPEDHY